MVEERSNIKENKKDDDFQTFTIKCDSDLAEELLTAIVHRCKQNGIEGTETCTKLIEFGKQLSRSFETKFNWVDFNNKRRKVFEFILSKKITVRIRKSN